MSFLYELHVHTAPVSACATADVRTTLSFYKDLGYDGVFITNHFLDGNTSIDESLPYEEKIRIYFSDYEDGRDMADEIGIKVFPGVEMTYLGTDFLVYGLDKEWYLAHPEIMDMYRSEELDFIRKSGGFVIQAHPFREDGWIDHIRLFPRQVDGIEVVNAERPDDQNEMARLYAEHYGLIMAAGSDNHVAHQARRVTAMETDTPLHSPADLIRQLQNSEMRIRVITNPLCP